MDLNSTLMQEHCAAYIASRLESRRAYQPGTGSSFVAMIGKSAAALRRIATRIEAWSQGNSEACVPHRHVSAR